MKKSRSLSQSETTVFELKIHKKLVKSSTYQQTDHSPLTVAWTSDTEIFFHLHAWEAATFGLTKSAIIPQK